MTIQPDLEKIEEIVSIYIESPSETLISSVAENGVQTALQKLNTAGFGEDDLTLTMTASITIAAEYYAISELIQALYNASEGGDKHVEHYLARADTLVSAVIEELSNRKDGYGNPISAVKTVYEYNTRYRTR